MGKAKKAQGTGGAAAAVERLVRPTVEGMGLQLWDVRFEKEGPDWFLRVLIDRDTPLDTDTCEAVSRAIDPILDEADPHPAKLLSGSGQPRPGPPPDPPGTLPGAERPKMPGPPLPALTARAGARSPALLEGLQDGIVTLAAPDGPVAFPLEAASYVKLCDDEDLF